MWTKCKQKMPAKNANGGASVLKHTSWKMRNLESGSEKHDTRKDDGAWQGEGSDSKSIKRNKYRSRSTTENLKWFRRI